jgi:hypothetical protein
MVGHELLKEMEEMMSKIKNNLKASQNRKKIYVDMGRIHKEFREGDHVFLKVKANISSLKLGNFFKLATRYCGSFEILERNGPITYMLALPASMYIHNVFHISLLKKYIPGANHVIYWNVIQVEKEGAFQVNLVCILDQKINHLWNRAIEILKVQWTWYGPKHATWEHEDVIQAEYPHLFEFF